MEYRIDRTDLREKYFFNDTGDVYYYMPNSIGGRAFLSFSKQVREVRSNEPGRSTHYLVTGLRCKDSIIDWVDVADMIVRTVFKIPAETKGYVRHKDGKYTNLELSNLEFVALHPINERPYGVHDMNGTIPMEYLTEDKQTNQVYWDELPGAKEFIEYVEKVRESRKKLDLGDRDRSVVAELLYSLIAEKEMSAADALKVLCIPGDYDTLELYLEGKDIVEERVVSDMEAQYKRDQERVENHPLVRARNELLAQGGQPGYRNKGTDPIEPN